MSGRKPFVCKAFSLCVSGYCVTPPLYDVIVLEGLQAEIDKLCGTDPAALREPSTIVELNRLMARLEAVTTRATAAFDTSREWETDGARTAAAWIRTRCGIPDSTARRRLRLGRALRHLPSAEAAWLEGDICDSHVVALDAVRTERTDKQFDRDEKMLVDDGRILSFTQFAQVLAYWAQHADPDGTEDKAKADRDARRVHLSHSLGGMWHGDMLLDPITGQIVYDELSRLEKQMFEAEWAELRQRLGQGAGIDDLVRPASQRRADALAEMARRSRTAPADGRRPEPLFTVLVDYETFAGRICEMANGTVVSPGTLVDWLDRSWIERVVFDGPSRVIDVGVAQRLFTGATRRAIEVRDRQCYHQFCEESASRCQADHIQPWSAGGPTTTKNGRLACGFHNRRRNRSP